MPVVFGCAVTEGFSQWSGCHTGLHKPGFGGPYRPFSPYPVETGLGPHRVPRVCWRSGHLLCRLEPWRMQNTNLNPFLCVATASQGSLRTVPVTALSELGPFRATLLSHHLTTAMLSLILCGRCGAGSQAPSRVRQRPILGSHSGLDSFQACTEIGLLH